ncbi:MAG TPA: Y-family DNA polymerase [Acinetobacter johnsonii]|nr:Y-family DNA polymerase [Acinetobacter johnsonii]
MFALCDGNSFYASCERVFRPELSHAAIVCVSNNDGCVVTRTAEAKRLGIKMGQPLFQIRHFIEQGKLVAFSSNYELYADLSRRMMQSIASLVPAIEVYSIDECFCDVNGMPNLIGLGHQIRERVLMWVGIPTCVGIAPTKTLAKFCNHLAKKYQAHFNGVLVWSDLPKERQLKAMASEAVDEVWGIGRQIGKRLQEQNIRTVLDFYHANTAMIRSQFGVVLERTQRELHGIACESLIVHEENRQHIVRSRSFGRCVNEIEALQAAVTHHIADAAAKLRAQGTQAHTVGVFIHTNRFKASDEQYFNRRHAILPMASANTLLLNHTAQMVLKHMFRPNLAYKKCGIELGGIENAESGVQQDLWLTSATEKSIHLMHVWDQIHAKFGKGRIKLGSELLSSDWLMNRDALSPCFTTRFSDLLQVT